MHSLYEPVHDTWTYRISIKASKIVYFGVSRQTRCLKVVWSLLQHSYFVYARCKSSGKAKRMYGRVGAFALFRFRQAAIELGLTHAAIVLRFLQAVIELGLTHAAIVLRLLQTAIELGLTHAAIVLRLP